MDCNKEEAVRAQQSAAKKMESKDFNTARKLATKAHLLYPSLDNILQMITVCDVHCSAEKKRFGNDKDWYGILQIATTADEASIKKQYRKFALLLHPDKNKFAGADDAFKLIGEAQRVLLDVDKRRLHDLARTGGRSNATNRAPYQHSTTTVRPPNMRNPPWVHNNFNFTTGSNMNNSMPGQNNRSFHNSRETFWTACPYCFVRYEFYKDVMNKLLSCQSCNRTFTGVQVNNQGAAFGSTFARPVNPIFRPTPPAGIFVKVETGLGSKGPIPNSMNNPQKKRQKKESKSSRKANRKRRKQVVESSESSSSSDSSSEDSEEGEDAGGVVESSESCRSESSSDDEEVVVKGVSKKDSATGQNPGGFDERYPRRSSRSKPNVSYNEKNLSGDDEVKDPSKTAKHNGAPLDADEQMVEDSAKNEQNGENETEKETVKKTEIEEDEEEVFDDDNRSENEPKTVEYPDPDFSDFDKEKEEKCFQTGQIWAAYDPSEALPRYYARIKKVFSPGFKLRITWLEPSPDEDSAINWVIADLPISCGNYRHGKSEICEDLPMFSHMVYWEKGNGRDTYKIYPVKGETWALFKNWDINWGSEPDNNRTYSYDFVEVLSNFVDEAGIRVAYLSKVKGFSCLFCRTSEKEKDSVQIAAKDILRFSHRVPSCKMTGKEREGVPEGSFELDPAALPTNLAIPEINIPNPCPNGASSSSKKKANPI